MEHSESASSKTDDEGAIVSPPDLETVLNMAMIELDDQKMIGFESTKVT